MIFRFKDELTSQAIRNFQGQHFKPRTKVSLEKRPSLTSVNCTISSNVSCELENWTSPPCSSCFARLKKLYCGFDRSNFRLAGHVDRSKFNRTENEINLRFLLFSCYLSSCCVLQNFDMKSWWHANGAVVYNWRMETDIGIRPLPVTKLPNISTFISNFQVVHLSLHIN